MARFFSLTRTCWSHADQMSTARRLGQVSWLLLTLLCTLHVLLSIPLQWAAIKQQANGSGLGVYHLGFSVGVPLLYIGCASFLFSRTSRERMTLYTAFTLVAFGATVFAKTDALTVSSQLWSQIVIFLAFLAQTLYFLYFFLFPDGHFMPRWLWPLAPLFSLLLMCLYFFPNLPFSGWFLRNGILWTSLSLCAAIIAVQAYRYARVSNAAQRQQTRWVVLALMLFPLTLLIGQSINLLTMLEGIHPLIAREINFGLSALGLASIPLSIVFATLRYQLWNIDRLLNRTAVYTTLTVCVISIYIVVVGGLAWLFQLRTNILTSLIATGLIAVIIHPLRIFLQRGINRLMYGERDEPRTVLLHLGQRLEDTLSPHAMLDTIVEVLAQTLKLPYTAIRVRQESGLELVAAYGTVSTSAEEQLLRLPLIAQKAEVGEMLFAPRSPGEAFTGADQKLLREIMHQVGMAVHTLQLTNHLQHLTSDLQRSRERLVLAREEERRRIRRDLHDGLAPTLAALALNASTVGDLIEINPDAAKALANKLQAEIRMTVGDIRRLVYDLRPPALDQLGLLTALREHITQGTRSQVSKTGNVTGHLEVSMQAPDILPTLPAAVEVAAYRIVQEALMNVRRHAQAQSCRIEFSLPEGPHMLQIEVVDDGQGIAEEYQAGVGLGSMQERAAELGGTCAIKRREQGGTRICARLPILQSSMEKER
ncbi:MAG: histidine kinase [Chloroflexota bacterium]|nr:histidine kinase [Chloroflexota bacterium]